MLRIERDDLRRSEVRALLNEHLTSMHALGLQALRSPDVTFWTVWEGDALMGCGALKELDSTHGEVKSMRTPARMRRRGAGRAVLAHILAEARARGYKRLSLETGSMDEFKPAHKLYESFGFSYCGPFGPYNEDPYSTFMTLELK